jgi:hypothetical protein
MFYQSSNGSNVAKAIHIISDNSSDPVGTININSDKGSLVSKATSIYAITFITGVPITQKHNVALSLNVITLVVVCYHSGESMKLNACILFLTHMVYL